jgi:hypothetical protein
MSDFQQSFEQHTKDFSFLYPGKAAVCGECLASNGVENTGEIDAMQQQLYELEEPHFSWSPCQACGSTLGGDRYVAHGDITEKSAQFHAGNTSELIHLHVCVDCIQYIANDELPQEDDQS